MRAWRGDEDLSLGARQQKALLASLLLRGGRTATAEELMDGIWGEEPPNQAKAALRTYASGIRKALGADAGVLVSESGGYALRWHPAEAALDADIAAALATDAEKADRSGDPGRARELYDVALEQWNGEALAHVPGPYAGRQRIRLEEWRLGLLEHRLDLDVRLGRHAEVVSELTTLTATYPLRERFASLLMLALYRSGRQGEALAVYDTARNVLSEELGIDPGPELQQRHQQILTSDTALALDDVGGTASSALARRTPVPRQLPAPPALFTGRGQELAQLSAVLADGAGEGGMVVIAAVGGVGGIGKTYLVLRWAHDHRGQFPDGELYANLRGFDPSGPPVPPKAALRGFLDALGVDPAAVPDDLEAQAGLYRSIVEGRRMLILLDNARDTAHVKDLIPGSGTCTVLVTSRTQLSGLVTEHAASSLPLGVLAEDDAQNLFMRRLGPDRITAEPQAAAEILGRCGGLPLALSIVAARAAAQPHLPLAVLADELTESADRLDALNAGEVTADLRAVFSTSYTALQPETARAFALLGLAPGPDISLPAAASLIAATLPHTRTLLRTLETAHLLRQHTPGRYQLHDLVHLFAAERARQDQNQDVRTTALRRLADFYLHTAHQAVCQVPARAHVRNLVLDPPASGCSPHRCEDAASAREWFKMEDSCLRAVHQLTREHAWDSHIWQLPAIIHAFRSLHGGGLDDMNMWQVAIGAANRLKDPVAQAVTHNAAGTACTDTGRHSHAQTHLQKALHLFDETANPHGQADTLHMLGCSWEQQGDSYRALQHHERALMMFRATGNSRWEANSLNAIGWCYALLGNYDQARSYCDDALTLARTSGDQLREAYTLDSLGYIAYYTGNHSSALCYYQKSVALFQSGGSWAVTGPLQRLGDTYFARRQFPAARRVWQQALELFRTQHRDADIKRLQECLDTLDEQGAVQE